MSRGHSIFLIKLLCFEVYRYLLKESLQKRTFDRAKLQNFLLKSDERIISLVRKA